VSARKPHTEAYLRSVIPAPDFVTHPPESAPLSRLGRCPGGSDGEAGAFDGGSCTDDCGRASATAQAASRQLPVSAHVIPHL